MINIELHFHPKEKSFPSAVPTYDDTTPQTQETKNNNDTSFPMYTIKGNFWFKNKLYNAVYYQVYYAENPAQGFGNCLFPRSGALGYHLHDVEKLMVLTLPGAVGPSWVYFGAHSKGQGMWVPWKSCEKNKDGHLIAYVALHAHGMYPKPSIYPRIFGFANDCCSKKGLVVRPASYVPSFPFISENGIQLSSTIPKIPMVSISPLERFLLPIMMKRIRERVDTAMQAR